MKTNIKLFTIGLAAAFGAGLMSCSDSETYDVRGVNHNLMFISNTGMSVTNCNMYTTPALLFGEVKASVPVHTQYRVGSKVTVNAVVDTTLTGQYNEKRGTKAVAVPQEVAQAVQVTSVEIEPNATKADGNIEVSLPEESMQYLTAEEYVLPLRLVGEDTQGERKLETSEYGVIYVAIHNNILDRIVSLNGNERSTTILKTPGGYSGNINSTFDVKMSKTLRSDVTVALTPNTSLVAAYNTKHGTDYKPLPDKVVSAVAPATGVIAAGQNSVQLNVKASNADFSALSTTTYLLPLQMATTYANGNSNPNENDVAYIFVTLEESNIEANPTTIAGKTVTDISAWKCISASNFDPAKLTTNQWMPLAKQSQGEFVVDFGAMHKITGFQKTYIRVSGGDSKIYFSEDGKEWTSPGSLGGKNTVKDANNNDCYVLSTPVQARYVKLHLYYDTAAFSWRYFGQSWANYYFGLNWNVVFDD